MVTLCTLYCITHCMPRQIKVLVLHGAMVEPEDFPASAGGKGKRDFRLQLLAWARSELAIHTAFITLLLGVQGGASKQGGTAIAEEGAERTPELPRNQLVKLRGDRNTDARMRIAGAMGVRMGAELRGLRRAVGVLEVLEPDAGAPLGLDPPGA